MTHKSYAHEHKVDDNERLEFIGDAMLDAAMAIVLAQHYPNANEGELSKMRAALVSDVALAKIANDLELSTFIQVGKGEASQNGATKTSILAGAFEALCAVVCDEVDFEYFCEVIDHLFKERIASAKYTVEVYDPKTKLQELVQGQLKVTPTYKTSDGISSSFRSVVSFAGIEFRGIGSSKTEAERDAAVNALSHFSMKE